VRCGLTLTIRLTWLPRRQYKTALLSAPRAHCHTRPRRQRAGFFFMNSSASVADVWTPLTRSRRGRSKRDCTRHPGLDQHFKNLRGIGRFFRRKLADSTGSNFVTCSFFIEFARLSRSKSDSTLLEFSSPVVSLTLLLTARFVTALPPWSAARARRPPASHGQHDDVVRRNRELAFGNNQLASLPICASLD
jgi:hypothetical protein